MDDVVFNVTNSVPNTLSVKEGGIGLENLRRRLELLYPGEHEFYANIEEKHFKARLKIPLHAH